MSYEKYIWDKQIFVSLQVIMCYLSGRLWILERFLLENILATIIPHPSSINPRRPATLTQEKSTIHWMLLRYIYDLTRMACEVVWAAYDKIVILPRAEQPSCYQVKSLTIQPAIYNTTFLGPMATTVAFSVTRSLLRVNVAQLQTHRVSVIPIVYLQYIVKLYIEQ